MKIIIGIILCLVVVICGEFAYLLTRHSNSTNSVATRTMQSTTNATPTPALTERSDAALTDSNIASVTDAMKNLKKDLFVSAFFTTVLKGKIEHINTQGVDTQRDGAPIHAVLVFDLVGNENSVLTFHITASELAKTTLLKTINGQTVQATVSDFHNGDEIHLQFTSPVQTVRLANLKITKL